MFIPNQLSKSQLLTGLYYTAYNKREVCYMRFCFPHQFGIENCNLIESTINIPGTCNRRWTVQLMQKIIVLFFEIHGIYVDFCCLISAFLMIRACQ